MSLLSHHRRSANEKSFEELQADIAQWNQLFKTNTEEIAFIHSLLTSDVFDGNVPNLFENLQQFYDQLEDLKIQKIDLHEEIGNHRNDLNGMMECDDISCESFYYKAHLNLENRILEHLAWIQELKMKIFRFCTPVLRKNK